MDIRIRQAAAAELDWVNEQYDKVRFQHSVFEQEFIAIAEIAGEKVGVGRLVNVSETVCELGGMFVDEAYRGAGVAKQLVTYLQRQATGKMLYCLPFAHLEHFYASCGFSRVANALDAPETVRQKWEWCNQTYPQKTLLMAMQAKNEV